MGATAHRPGDAPDRAPLVQWAFEAYATGEWTIRSITDELAARGFKVLPHRRKVPGPGR